VHRWKSYSAAHKPFSAFPHFPRIHPFWLSASIVAAKLTFLLIALTQRATRENQYAGIYGEGALSAQEFDVGTADWFIVCPADNRASASWQLSQTEPPNAKGEVSAPQCMQYENNKNGTKLSTKPGLCTCVCVCASLFSRVFVWGRKWCLCACDVAIIKSAGESESDSAY